MYSISLLALISRFFGKKCLGQGTKKNNVARENRPLEKEVPTNYWKPLFLGAMCARV